MTFVDGKMPPSTDIASLWPSEDGAGVRVQCDYCGVSLGTARYLNQVILLWAEHQASEWLRRRDKDIR